jgi:hypothetical protein
MLYEYQQRTQLHLKDLSQVKYSTDDLRRWINQARNWVCGQSQCLRAISPINGHVSGITLLTGGNNYLNPTVQISSPNLYGGVQATATAVATGVGASLQFSGSGPITFQGAGNIAWNGVQGAGPITKVTLTGGGSGYTVPPNVSFTGGGTGATAIATIAGAWTTQVQQEVYPFSALNSLIQAAYPGFQSIIAVQSVAVAWGAWKPVLQWIPWSLMQAYLRSLTPNVQNQPIYASKYGQGVNGSIYIYPVPSQILSMEWDCYCIPTPLVDDTTFEPIPYPWTEAVPFMAAYYGYLNDQQPDRALGMLQEYRRSAVEGRAMTQVSEVPDFYGDY